MTPSSPDDDPAVARFPIVAVGASAGGLAPTMELLSALGPEPGVALVVVHHLDPTHESGIVELLARTTAMPVAAAVDGVRVQRDHVYVIPPNAGLTIASGALEVGPRVETGGMHLPIDRFLASLAHDLDGLGVGVVLSGGGFDGTEGIRAIKSEGGITLAQDGSAASTSMPEAAIATGCVDFIGPPAALAREIVRIAAHAPSVRRPRGVGLEEAEYGQILAAMRQVSGVDFASYKPSTIRRRLQRRLVIHGLPDLKSYVALVSRNRSEASALCDEVLIHVTGFFRDPDLFEALSSLVLPKLCAGRSPHAALRVWIPGCSTGEEVYSLAIVVLEFLERAGRSVADVSSSTTWPTIPLKMFGTDLDPGVIEKARAGRYPESIERDVSAERLQRFFTKDDAGGYRIRRNVRDLCVFARHDVTNDPPFSSMDLISCRNVLIYLGPELQERVLALLHYALSDQGFLALGSSETVRAFAGFSPIDGKNKIYARSAAAARTVFDFASPRLFGGANGRASSDAGAAGSRELRDAAGRTTDVFREADRVVLAEHGPPGVVVTSDLAIVQFRGQTGPFLEPAPGAASLELLRMARAELRLPLRRALDAATSTGKAARESGVALFVGNEPRAISLEVLPFAVRSAPQQRFFVVLFHDTQRDARRDAPTDGAPAPAVPTPEASNTHHGVDALERELASTRDYLESVIERLEAGNQELRAANEEVVSSNEELRSTNDELHSAKEELQATNEELGTVNDELKARNVEATLLSDDLANVFRSAEIPMLIVGRDFCLRRFTPAAARLFALGASDVQRPVIACERLAALVPTLLPSLTEVLDRLHTASLRFQDGSGRWYDLSVRPYITAGGRIDGTVVAAHDIDAETRSTERVDAARRYAEDIVETVRDGLVVFDRDLRVRSANSAFGELFRLRTPDILGQHIDALPEPAAPTLRKVLADLGQRAAFDGLEREGAAEGARVLSVSARRVGSGELVLLALDDVTEVERARTMRAETEQRRAYQERLQQLSFENAVTEERERRRIALELHDRIGQDLALAQIRLATMAAPLDADARATVDGAVELLEKAIVGSRTLVFELSPPVLYDLGLGPALAWLAEDVAKRHQMRLEISDDGLDKPLGDTGRAIVFRAVRELVMNVFKHAGVATANLAVRRSGDDLRIDLADEGVGFEPGAPSLGGGPAGFGLLSVREQIARLGGTLEIEAAPGRGTRASLRVPLDPSRASAP